MAAVWPSRDLPPDARRERAVAAVCAAVANVATFPAVALEIGRVVDDAAAGVAGLRSIVGRDQALSTRVLKVANSALFRGRGAVDTLDTAILRLGFRAVQNIAIAASLTTLFRAGPLAPGVSAEDLWTHALAVATASSLLAARSRLAPEGDVFLAGLVHDIGMAAELQVDREGLAQVIVQARSVPDVDFRQIEVAAFGADHQAFGAALLARWGLPPALVQAAGAHHDPWAGDPALSGLAWFVHVADWIVVRHGGKPGLDLSGDADLDDAAVEAIGLTRAVIDDVVQAFAPAASEVEAAMQPSRTT